jgi:hypothetical protein
MSRVLVLVLIAVGAVACGGGGDDPAAAPDTSSPSAAASTPDAESAAGSKVDAAADLSEFVCEPDDDGEWNASGVITNSSGEAADYRVTVVVSDGPGASLAGKRRTLPQLSPEAPEPFDIKRLPSVDDTDATCQVEVLRFR